MERVLVSNGAVSTLVNFNSPQRATDSYQSILIAQAFDELTGNPIDQPIRVTTDLPDVTAKSSSSGICGLAGIPTQCLHDLKNRNYIFNLVVEAAGYEPLNLSATIPQDANFPNEFVRLDLDRLDLRRSTNVAGCTQALGAQNQLEIVPLAGVSVTGIWRKVSDLSGSVDTGAAFLSVTPSLYASRPNSTTVTIVPAAPVAAGTTLNKSAFAGTSVIEVNSLSGISGTDVVAIDLGSERSEYLRVASIDAPANPNSPALLTLAFPLKFDHALGVPVAAIDVSTGASDAALTEECLLGDWTIFVDSATAFGAPVVARLSSASLPDEFVTCAPYEVTSGNDGYYRLPRLSRIAAIRIASTKGTQSGVVDFSPNYNLHQNTLNLTLK
jgi:hypothetical protein